MKKLFLLILLFPVLSYAQNVLPNANTIIVSKVGFAELCSKLLDSGYVIEKKDNDLMTVNTAEKKYPNRWNAAYSLYIRVKDSIAYISGTFSAPPGGGLFKNEPIKNWTNKKGETKSGSMGGYAFVLMNQFAQSFGKDVDYAIK